MRWLCAITFLTLSVQGFSQHKFKPSPEVAHKLANRAADKKKEEDEERKKLEALTPKIFAFNQRETAIIHRCNTAKHSWYHSESEKEFILLMNLARIDKETLNSYISHRYDSSFIYQLPEIRIDKKRLILKSSYGLHLSAKVHAKKSGRKGTTGHQNVDRRLKMFNFYFKRHPIYGENCSYNDTDHPLIHFIQLMNSKPHYKGIMDVEFNAVGVSFKQHIIYGMNSVTCFGFK